MKTVITAAWRNTLALISCGLLSLIVAGCATVAIPGADLHLLQFLQSGQTTRREVVLKLGQPSATFEQERILTYRLGHDPKQGYYVVSSTRVLSSQGNLYMVPEFSWEVARYSLVLIFDANGVLEKQSLVPVH